MSLINPSSLFFFLSVGAICVFTFVTVASWAGIRQAEREVYYKTELLRRLAEMPGEGALQVLEMMRMEERQKQSKKLEGMKLGGVINIAVGIGLAAFLYTINGPAMVGAIPGLIGVALLVYGLFLAPTIE